MSIQETISRIKTRFQVGAGEPSNTEIVEFDEDGKIVEHSLLDKLFISLVILLVSLGSFGLGKLSGGGERLPIEIRYENLDEGVSNLGSNPLENVSTLTEYKDGEVVVSKNGSKYHFTHCPGAKQIAEKNKIFFATAVLAEQAGYTLASNCKPR